MENATVSENPKIQDSEATPSINDAPSTTESKYTKIQDTEIADDNKK